jgi:parallel beta-helix repeat protein
MTYTFKLSRRVALSRSWGMLLLLTLITACANDLQESSDPSAPIGELAEGDVVVTPNNVIIEIGQLVQLTARQSIRRGGRFDQRDETTVMVEWTASGGTISADGQFSAAEAGSFKVVGKGRGRRKTDTSTVVVVPPPEDIVGVTVAPDTAQLETGATRTFIAKAILRDRSLADLGVTWLATGGTIDAGGVYVAGPVRGHFMAVATSSTGELADTAAIVIDSTAASPPPPAPPTLEAVVLTPETATLSIGLTQQFVAQGKMSDGSTSVVSASWTATGGQITEEGLYTAGTTQGAYRVLASAEGYTDTAVVMITAAPTGCTPTATHFCPGDNLQAKVTAQSQGAAFTFGPGVYRMQSITPKSGQSFSGSPGTILSGAKVLTEWTADGTRWVAGGQTQENTGYNPSYTCQSGHPGCFRPEQLWVDGVLYEHVLSLSSVGPGKWHFDYAADRIYIPINPAGKLVETSVTRFAFGGSATGVTVRNLIVERYANEAQKAVVNHGIGAGWVIEGNEIRWNHGTGAVVGSNGIIRRNYVHHQGQMGIKAFGNNPLVEDNEIAYNNTAFFGPGPFGEAGGTKFVGTDGLIVRGNFSHHNDGPGLWTDINNVNCLYEGNRVEDNRWRGIFHEISYACIIRNNQVRRNGHGFPSTLGAFEGAGILISNSPNVEVYGNTVEDNRNGIMAREEDRPQHPSGMGPHNTTNLYVHDNIVKQTDDGRAAGVTDTDPYHDPYSAASNNRFARNVYVIGSNTKWRWAPNADVSRSQWQGAGQDSGSTFK